MSQTLNFKDFLLESSSKDIFDITAFYERVGVRYDDRNTIECSIKSITNCILEENSEYNVILREICCSLSAGDYLLLRNESCENYWGQKQQREYLQYLEKEKINDELRHRRSKRLKINKEFPTEQDKVLPGFSDSTSSMIKLRAHNILMGKKFSELDCLEKNTVSNGFNSILDLTDNNNGSASQKSLFSKEQWDELNSLYNKKIQWKPIDAELTLELKEIEKLAEKDIKEAYKFSLSKQIKYAFSKEEALFKVYSIILSALNSNPSILSFNNKNKYTEEDYIVKLWGSIISSIYDDSSISTKWGESVYEESSQAKRNASNPSSVGDKVDCRVFAKGGNGEEVDVMNIEFARHHNSKKFQDDHRKILREGKVIADHFYSNPYLKKRIKRNIVGTGIQIAGIEGHIKKVKLVDKGLYVATKLGSLRLPSSCLELKKARTLIERLLTIKHDFKYLANCQNIISNETMAATKNMDLKLNMNRSPYDEVEDEAVQEKSTDEYLAWIRGSWFPLTPRKEKTYDGKYPDSLFNAL